jgi:hypothetical protein
MGQIYSWGMSKNAKLWLAFSTSMTMYLIWKFVFSFLADGLAEVFMAYLCAVRMNLSSIAFGGLRGSEG